MLAGLLRGGQSGAAATPYSRLGVDGNAENVGAIRCDGFITILSDLRRFTHAGNARAIYPIGEHGRIWLVTCKPPLPAGDGFRGSDVARHDTTVRRGGMDEYVRLRRLGVGN